MGIAMLYEEPFFNLMLLKKFLEKLLKPSITNWNGFFIHTIVKFWILYDHYLKFYSIISSAQK